MKVCTSKPVSSQKLSWLKIENFVVRTPLNAIINYLEIALESPLDSETRDNLMRSHSASKSLIYVINDLLDLTRAEEGQDLVMDEIFDLSNTIREATSIYKSDTERKNISLEVIEYAGVPKLVKGDQSRLRQAVSNITGNAIKHTNEGSVKIEIWMSEVIDDHCQAEIAIQDTGVGISLQQLDMLFREFEQVHTEDESDVYTPTGNQSTQSRTEQTFDGLSKIPGQKVLGLGLAVVARTIRNMNGQLRLKSEEGKGSRFTISLPFTIPSETEAIESGAQPLAAIGSPPSRPQSMTPPLERNSSEFLLVGSKLSRNLSPTIIEKKDSSGSMNSSESQNSERSEIDRIVHAISSLRVSPSSSESSTAPRPATSTSPISPRTNNILDSINASPPTLHPLTAPHPQPGQEVIKGSAVPLKAVRVPEESLPASSSKIPPSIPMIESSGETSGSKGSANDRPGRLKVLVAEDDPINSKIIKKRMEKLGHEVSLTVNGAECADLFMKTGKEFDIVLMDMQVCIPLNQILPIPLARAC